MTRPGTRPANGCPDGEGHDHVAFAPRPRPVPVTRPVALPPRAGSTSPPHSAPAGEPSRVRALIIGYALTLSGLLIALTMLLVVWEVFSTTSWVDAHQWPAAVAATSGWAGAAVLWLHRRGWRPATAHAVAWITPAVLLAPLSGSTWLSPAGLVLWAPMTAVLAAAVVMAERPTVAPSPTMRPGARLSRIASDPAVPTGDVDRDVPVRRPELGRGRREVVADRAG
jgi:hypothetical protein